MPRLLFLFLVVGTHIAQAQTGLGKLTVEKIMRDPKWIGTSPSGMRWSADGQYLFFNWNPTAAPADSVYYISTKDHEPKKAAYAFAQETVMANSIVYNNKRTACVYVKNSDIYYKEIKTGKTKRIVNTAEFEYNPQFAFNDQKIIYTRSQNLYAWDISSGETEQLTRIHPGGNSRPGGKDRNESDNEQEKWLRKDQLANFDILKQRRERKEARDDYNKAVKEKEMRSIGIEDKNLQSLALSPDGRFVSYRLYKSAGGNKGTLIPDYVTESGFTTDLPGRTKVGEQPGIFEFFVYDRTTDSLYSLTTDTLPGIKDLPDYVKDYPVQLAELTKKPMKRPVSWSAVGWSPEGNYLLLDIQSQDNKDRWLAIWDAASLSLHAVQRERNEAWVGGPGFYNMGWLNNETIWFQSEASGYSHLYTLDIKNGNKKQLTSGNYEVQDAELSADKKYFYLTTNEVHPGEKHFYRLPVTGGKAEKLTTLTGSNQVLLSPDEKTMAVIYSYSNKPAELYWQEAKAMAKMEQVTDTAQTPEFKSYNWKDPEVINFKAGDGATVYARLYRPANPHPTKPAVIFVHGAGYLQNAHKWWSSYFREYMFHNMLADEGYTVMDIDYRGSAGYGRDWRTGIYRFMGGKDLTDHVDAAEWLVKNAGISKDRIGIYGGSYGGFITLMAMFTTPDVFAAGAALRPVTDWAQYNHGYTSNILNEPARDSIAYRRSSPFYYANGLKGALLICHGMVDVNVHYQDAVKLTQRLIELGKDNWELASYPMEDHGFTEPSSWTDEYKRIFKLFETVLKKGR